MTATTELANPTRVATRREYLMCPPEHFEVTYAINPWMDPAVPVNRAKALTQWLSLKETYEALGHTVRVVDAAPSLPDMVFAANGGVVIDGIAYGASFLHPERQPEGRLYQEALRRLGLKGVVQPTEVNEGEGDFLVVGDAVLAGTGFRTSRHAHVELGRATGLPVYSLTLVDPRYYHLDTALAVLDRDTVAYLPAAFDDASVTTLQQLFPDALVADDDEAAALCLNAVSDGRNVVLTDRAPRFADALSRRGFTPVPVDLSELLKAGGSVKCCTMEIRR
jgi:ornithine--oxo-acid transaminase